MVYKYVKKPIIISAVQWTGDNIREVLDFSDNIYQGLVFSDDEDETDNNNLTISTLEGFMTASLGNYIIKGIRGEVYPCQEDIFLETYDLVN